MGVGMRSLVRRGIGLRWSAALAVMAVVATCLTGIITGTTRTASDLSAPRGVGVPLSLR